MTLLVRDVGKRYGTFTALDAVSLEIPRGALVALLGPSGSGKTTLLRVLAGLERPDTGQITHDGADLLARPARDRGVGLVFQHYALFRHLDVFENVAFALRVRRRPRAEVAARVDELLHLVQLDGLARRLPAQLSGGQRQRVALARALAASPRILLLDEPFGALDAQVRHDLRRWLRRLHDHLDVTTVLVTHDQAEAFEVADRIVLLDRGRIAQIGTPTDLLDHPASDFVLRFLGHVNLLPGPRHVRPHDLDLSLTASSGPAATITRLTPLGAALRIELDAGPLGPLLAELDRTRAATLALSVGTTVWISVRTPTESLVRAA